MYLKPAKMKFDYRQFEESLEVLVAQDVIDGWEGFGPGHYRINGVLDIWPRRSKYFYHPTAEHGEYEELVAFIDLVCPKMFV